MTSIISPHLEYSSAGWILQWIYVCRNHLEKVLEEMKVKLHSFCYSEAAKLSGTIFS